MSVFGTSSGLAFGHVALRIGSRKIRAELPDDAHTIIPDPRAKVAQALLIRVGDLPREPWLGHPLLVQKLVKVSQQAGLTLVIGTRQTPQRDEALHLVG
jgi:hypothetical protein